MVTKSDIITQVNSKLKSLNLKNKHSIISELSTLFGSIIPQNIKTYLADTYKKQARAIYKDVIFNDNDKNIIYNYSNSKLLWQAYANTNVAITKKINSIIASNYEDGVFDMTAAKKQFLKEIPELSKNRINTILRTENSNIRRLALEQTYNKLDPEGEFRYKWIIARDSRTTNICKRIAMRTSKGVSMEDLKRIIEEEADPKTYTPDRPFSPHLNCRSTYIKV